MADTKKPYGDVSYADPGYQTDGKKRYPLDSADHCRAAWSYINMPKNAEKYTASQLSLIKGRIKAAAKRFGITINDDGNRGRELGRERIMTVSDIDHEEFSEESLKVAVLAENEERIYTSQWRDWKIACPVELRSGAESRLIGGYALKFNKPSQNLGGYVERIAPSFPSESRAAGWPGVVCRYNHNDEMVLGTTHSGTLKVFTDDIGMLYEVDVPQCRGDVLEMVSRRDVAHSSFAFEVIEQEWGVSEQNFPERTLISGRIIDVAPVLTPAYRDTTVAMRSLAKFLDAPLEDVIQAHREREIRKFFVRTDKSGEVLKATPPISGMKAKMDLLRKRGEDPIGK